MKTNNFPVAVAILIGCALLFAGCTRPSAEPEVVDVGSPAPAFKLPDLQGQEVSLAQYKGKVVLLDFWATWCNPCRMTMPVLEKLEKEYPQNMVLLAINLQDSKDVVQEYMHQQNLSSRVLLDEQGSVGAAYGAAQIPLQVLIDKAGIVRHIQYGFSGRLASQLRAQIENLK